MSKNVLLISVQAVKDRTGIHKNMDESLILSEIKAAQDEWIVPALGTRLFEQIQDGIETGPLETVLQTLLDKYITDALVWFTVAALPISAGFQFFTKGVMRHGDDNASAASMSDMREVIDYYKNRGEFYRERLIRYLRVNSSAFPEYEAATCDDDILPASSGYSVPFWLGDD